MTNHHHHYRGEVPLHDNYGPEARFAVEAEALLPQTRHEQEIAWALENGLQGADSIVDRTIPTFSRGELPHFAGINTFLKAHYEEDVKKAGDFDVAILGAPFDGGTTYRSGTRFGPQGIRKISALYGPYSFELGVDLRESLTMCDLGDIFTIPANIEKTFDQISKATAHVFESGAFPIVLGGDHSIGYPTVRGVAEKLNGKLGIIHFDRHVDTQETDLDERMHTTPWFHATDIPNVPAKNLVQIGIGGWQAPRPGVKVGRERGTTIMTVTDCVEMGIEDAAQQGARSRLGRRRCRLAELRRRLPGRGVRPGHGLAGAGRLPAPRGAEVPPDHRRLDAPRRHGGSRVLAALRQRRDHLAAGDARDLRHAGLPGALRPPGQASVMSNEA